MRSINRIRERDIDPDFLFRLINDTPSLNVTELLRDYVKKDDILSYESLPSEYVNKVNDSLQALQNDIIDIKDKYRLKTNPISVEDFNEEVFNTFKAMAIFLQHIKTDDNIPLISITDDGEKTIFIIDEDGKEYPVIIPITANSSNVDSIEITKLQAQIDALQRSFNNLQHNVKVLQITGSTGTQSSLADLDMDSLTVEQLLNVLQEQDRTINNLKQRLDTLQGTTDPLSIGALGQRISQTESDIRSIQDQQSVKVSYESLNITLQEKLDTIVDMSRRLSLVESNKMDNPVLDQNGYLYYSADTGYIIQARPPIIKAAVCNNIEDVITARNNKEKFIINISTGEGYMYDRDTETYDIVQVERSSDYNYLFILNTVTELIEYFVLEGTIVKLNSLYNSAQLINNYLTVRKANIAAGSSFTVQRINNLKKLPPLVLVYDFEEDSRTHGMYINSENVITVSHDTESFTLHNDCSYEVEALIMAGD